MKGRKRIILNLIILFFGISIRSIAQTPTIDFSVTDLGKGKIKINWKNTFETCSQLSVQQSFDSLKSFKTILTVHSPALPDNGFIYNNTSEVKTYYRIFFVLDGGNYFFTKSKSVSFISVIPYEKKILQKGEINQQSVEMPEEIKIEDIPFLSRKRRVNSDIITDHNQNLKAIAPTNAIKSAEKRFIHLYFHNRDSLIKIFEYAEYKNFKDSIIAKTKDTLYAINQYDVILMPFVPKYVWKPSQYIFTNHNGYVAINIPDALHRHYRIVFFEDDGSSLFEIKHVKEAELVLDKTNFVHAGWFRFELFEDDKLKEKNKFYLDKEF